MNSIHEEGEQKFKVTCSICQKTFKEDRSLKWHLESVHGTEKKIFQCKICSMTFHSKLGISRHQKTIHEESRPRIKCEFCPQTFLEKKGLKCHIEDRHSDDNKAICTECGTLINRKYLQYHIERILLFSELNFYYQLIDHL